MRISLPGIAKGLLVANLAAGMRLFRCGKKDFARRLRSAYDAIDPFEAQQPRPPEPGAAPERPESMDDYEAIPQVTLGDLVSYPPLVLIDSGYGYVDGALNLPDLLPLLAIARDRNPACVLEIGTYFGHTARLLAANLPESVIHTIDLPETFDPQQRDDSPLPKDDFHLIERRRVGQAYLSARPAPTNIRQHFGDTANWDFGNARGATFFFIDGSHTYEYVRNDTEKCLRLAGGKKCTVMWHDCDWWHPGVVRWLREMRTAGWPVKRIPGTHLAVMDCPEARR